MKARFTPQPWLQAHHPHDVVIEQEPGRMIQFATLHGPDAEANKLLIAAAPDLYRILEAAAEALRSYQYGNASIYLAEEMASACDAVLAKARGEKTQFERWLAKAQRFKRPPGQTIDPEEGKKS